MVAMVAAREGGATVDDKLLHGQAEFTHKWFAAQVKNMKLGRGIGGRAMNVGYGLWALRLADSKADETTEAMITYLVKTQNADGHWEGQVKRPPLEESLVMATVLSCAGMQKYATDSFIDAQWLSNDWAARIDPKRAVPLLDRLGDNAGLRLAAPRIYRSAPRTESSFPGGKQFEPPASKS